jgi:hypothetical protein
MIDDAQTQMNRSFAMPPSQFVRACVTVCGLVSALGMAANAPADGNGPNMFGFADPTGVVRTYKVNGAIDFDNPFFQSLGTNGRSCGSCHQPADGWTIVPSHVQARFEATDGEDPIFRTNDGSNSPNADVSTVEGKAIRLQHAADQRAHPRRHRCAGQCRVRTDRRG